MKTGSIWAEFEWEVATDYSLRETPHGLALVVAEGATTARKYRPFEKNSAGLFREFGDLDPTPEAILRFARRYGGLGGRVQRLISGDGDIVDLMRVDEIKTSPLGRAGLAAMIGGARFVGELLHRVDPGADSDWSWASQIRKMSSFLRWLKRGIARHEEEVPANSSETDQSIQGFLHQVGINQILAATVAPRLVLLNNREHSYQLRFEPNSLLGALWLQAAQAATEGMTFHRCHCGNLIAIARTTGARTDAKFCSDKCKSKDYRERMAEAKRLHRKGWTKVQIAKELGSSVKTVRGWIAK